MAIDTDVRHVSIGDRAAAGPDDVTRLVREALRADGAVTEREVEPVRRWLAENPERASCEGPRPDAAVARWERQQAALSELGRMAASVNCDLGELTQMTAFVLADVLDAEVCFVLSFGAGGASLYEEAGVGWSAERMSAAITCDAGTLEWRATETMQPVLVEDLAVEAHSDLVTQLRERDMVGGIITSIQGSGRPFGVLGGFTRRIRRFARADLQFVEAVAQHVARGVERRRFAHIEAAIVEDAADIVARIDADLRCAYTNAAFSVATGFDADAVRGRALDDLGLIPQPHLGSWRAAVRSALRSGRDREIDLTVLTPRGERRLQVRFIPDATSGRERQALLMLARDVTELARLQDECADLRRELVLRDRRHHEQIARLIEEARVERKRSDDATAIAEQLTPREIEILHMLTEGLTNRQMAGRLHLSAGTVRNHLGRLFPKLDAADRTQAAVRAVELGLVGNPVE